MKLLYIFQANRMIRSWDASVCFIPLRRCNHTCKVSCFSTGQTSSTWFSQCSQQFIWKKPNLDWTISVCCSFCLRNDIVIWRQAAISNMSMSDLQNYVVPQNTILKNQYVASITFVKIYYSFQRLTVYSIHFQSRFCEMIHFYEPICTSSKSITFQFHRT